MKLGQNRRPIQFMHKPIMDTKYQRILLEKQLIEQFKSVRYRLMMNVVMYVTMRGYIMTQGYIVKREVPRFVQNLDRGAQICAKSKGRCKFA